MATRISGHEVSWRRLRIGGVVISSRRRNRSRTRSRSRSRRRNRTRNSLPLPLPPRTESGIPVDVALTWPGLGTGAGQVWAKSRTQGVAITSGAPLESLRGY